jgi:hypothetical protein
MLLLVTIDLVEISDDNAGAVVAQRLAPGQERFVSSVADSIREADENPGGNPWFRDQRSLVSLEAAHRPPAPREGLRPGSRAADRGLVRSQGAKEAAHQPCARRGEPGQRYAKLGFVPRGDLDPDGEIILRLDLR